MVVIRTPEQLSQVIKHGRCSLVFIDVDWSIYAVRSRALLERFERAWSSLHMQSPVAFYRVDLTEQEGALWNAVRRWLESESVPADLLMSGGYGAIIWVNPNGSISSHTDQAMDTGLTELSLRELSLNTQAACITVSDSLNL